MCMTLIAPINLKNWHGILGVAMSHVTLGGTKNFNILHFMT